jgi:hypothetical protein
VTSQTRAPFPKWTVGFWFWQGSEVTVESKDLELDLVYFQAGTISHGFADRWYVGRDFPAPLPKAKEYWMVLRYERQGVPAMSAIPALDESFRRLHSEAQRRRIPLMGVQLDIDAPTGSLREYATFLRAVRKAVPDGMQLSITALLDWFRDGTAVHEVVKEVDEFVPQFYDLSDSKQDPRGIGLGLTRSAGIRPIAARIDSQVWAARFNKYGKRYRIGISSFGRSGVVSGGSLQVYGDLLPLTAGMNSAFSLQTERTSARELLLRYRATRPTKISYATFQPGDLIEFVMPTADAVREAHVNAKRMAGYCAGVLFFRWPVPDREIALSPAEVLHAIGMGQSDVSTPRVLARDGGCAAVQCDDLHLFNIDRQSGSRLRYTVTSSVPFEYFLPENGLPVGLSSPNEVEVVVPPFAGTQHLYLGRGVTSKRSEYSVTRGK